MRIIAGKYRGKKLFAPDNYEVRPTAERAREALFNILYSHLGGFAQCRVLDVFAGTGAFGLEALSRGAQEVALIDKNIRLAQKNAQLFSQDIDKIALISADAAALPFASKPFNLLFMDAPYAKGLSEKAILSLQQKGWLEDNALCLVEMRKDEVLNLPENFVFYDERIYGLAKIAFYIYRS